MHLLELFCGTKSVSKVAKKYGFSIISLDNKKNFNPTICKDILKWDYTEYPRNYFTFIWASPPCTEFSRAKTVGERNLNYASKLVKKTFEIIKYFNPKYFCIENPVGLLRTMPFMKPHSKFLKTVSYCKYGYSYRKNTDIWSNIDFKPKLCINGSYCSHKLNFGYHPCHVQQSYSYTNNIRVDKFNKVSSLNTRYSIPPKLLHSIFKEISI